MSRRTTWTRVRNLLAMIVAAAGTLALAHPADAAGVVINMPAPRKTPMRSDPAPTSVAAANPAPAAVAIQPKPDVGDVALSRYVGARVGPYDTYDSGLRYSGYNNYGYGYPWFWGFPGVGCFGNQFFGFVGCPSPCTNVGMKANVLHH